MANLLLGKEHRGENSGRPCWRELGEAVVDTAAPRGDKEGRGGMSQREESPLYLRSQED